MEKFINTFNYKLIYIFTIKSDTHNGYLKIGEATIHSVKDISLLHNSCTALNKAARERINTYTTTAGISYELLHTELALYESSGKIIGFRDYDVHNVLIASGIERKQFDTERKQNEWFEVDLITAISAIKAVKENRKSLNNSEISKGKTPILFRPEQKNAIKQTIAQFKKNARMLWNAKMRFGKTLSALEVVKQMEFKRTIIVTHRPVVSDSWFEDFQKIFYDRDDYTFGAKKLNITLPDLEKSTKNYVYFASIQDLRGSDLIGGKHEKNLDVFETEWDFVIIDEAHEGTKTELGGSIKHKLVGNNTKLLELSGTPFNLLEEYKESEIYTWDYVMEQSAKSHWIKNCYCDSNPYDGLPRLNIYTYSLNKLISGYEDFEDKAFNFREFFRTWTGDMLKDKRHIPESSKVGDFVHENDVVSFLNLITHADENSNYPFSTNEYREFFRHSLWMVPGVKEARALSALLKKHPVFGSGVFNIVNVAGDGDEEQANTDAMALVKHAIGNNPDEGYSITLSCGRLTTGVSVPEWTAVLMLSGSYSTRAASYMQTIFRVQTPASINGRMKEQCYVFDFAPDRTLKILAETSKISATAGKTSDNDRDIIGQFLNFCPVISIDGTQMREYDVDSMLQQLKQIYTDKVVSNGFDDVHMYNDKLLKLNSLDLKAFKELMKIIGTSKQTKKLNEVDVNDQGLTDEEYERLKKVEKKPKDELSEDEKALLEKAKNKNQQKQTAISILRGISIRIPLIIYGAELEDDEDITLDNFTEKIDALSWTEFMPKGVTKQMFNEFTKYFDPDIFVAAGRKIRSQSRNADALPPTERVQRIVQILSTFKNPDKETVLTPWRVVNMHLGDCLGGYVFYSEDYMTLLDEPRFVDHNDVTSATLANSSARILEINSKTGLYPLFVVYSIFRMRCKEYSATEFNEEIEKELWLKTVAENIYIICKTPMAKQITKRTLIGYKNSQINTRHFEDLINQIENKPDNFIKETTNSQKYFSTNTKTVMKFNAIVGNPPYQVMDGGAKASARPIYNHFVDIARKLNPNFASMIIPTRWYAGGKGLDEFRDSMLSDVRMRELYDYLNPADLFPNTNIRGGICYFLWDDEYNNKSNLTKVVTCQANGSRLEIMRTLKSNDSDTFIRHGMAISIIAKVTCCEEDEFISLAQSVSSAKSFGFRTYFISDERFRATKDDLVNPILCYGRKNKTGWVEYSEISSHKDWIYNWKVYVPESNNIGTELNDDNQNSFIGKPKTICTETFLVVGADLKLNEQSSRNLSKYLQSRFSRFLHSLAKISQHGTAKTYKFIPLQNFNDNSDINWQGDIDHQFYAKYKLTSEEVAFIESSIKPMK